jgi:hypothetical protein
VPKRYLFINKLTVDVMEADNKHFKFINSETGNTIYYHCCGAKLREEERKAELEKIKAQVAIKYGLFLGTVYWEEVKEGN